MPVLTMILISCGAGVLLYSIFGFHRLMKKCREETYRADSDRNMAIFNLCVMMMYGFLAGYVSVLILVIKQPFQTVFLVVALIFFFGALFVWAATHTLWAMNIKLSDKNDELMNLLVTSIEMKDIYTKGHSRHVRDIVELFCERLPKEYREKINLPKMRDAALLHDIGKIGIPDAILKKPNRLSDEEWNYMRVHPENGKIILSKTVFEEISDWVCYHHERMDGQGYYNIPGDQIPLEARIISIADTYSALSTDRIYRQRFPHEKALEIMDMGAGTQFDAQLLDFFKQIPPDGLEQIYQRHQIEWTRVMDLNKMMHVAEQPE